ncbi:MAG: DUF2271 domain-containing protein [Spirochaetales bacterium]|jgi:hypothetical protein|nr:DUF2271 domain-containing protein [Spirochaetales bacterium]
MKKLLSGAVILCVLGLAGAAAQAKTSVEVSFAFTRQSGSGSNQFAVWIEDSGGRYIKTLFATRFTARGGWQKRQQSIPLWVRQSGLSGMGQKEIDAFTGATPSAGNQVFIWDGTDAKGNEVPAGDYRVYVEATLRGEDRVVYSAAVRLNTAPGEAGVSTQYFGTETAERAMIAEPRVRVIPR